MCVLTRNCGPEAGGSVEGAGVGVAVGTLAASPVWNTPAWQSVEKAGAMLDACTMATRFEGPGNVRTRATRFGGSTAEADAAKVLRGVAVINVTPMTA